MKKKIIIPAIAFILILSSSFTHPVSINDRHAAIENIKAGVVVSNWMISLDQTFYIGADGNGEMVRFTGMIHLQTKFIPTDPVRVRSNLVSLQGIGLTSGLPYYISGSDQTEQLVTLGSEFSTDHSYNFLPPSPILPPNPVRFRYTMNLNLIGELINASAEILPPLIIEG